MRGTDSFGKIYTKTLRLTNITIPANGQANVDFSNALDSGETYLGLVGWDGGSITQTSIGANLYEASTNRVRLWVSNMTNSQKTLSYYQVTILVKGGE